LQAFNVRKVALNTKKRMSTKRISTKKRVNTMPVVLAEIGEEGKPRSPAVVS
jgi:hypothetical protein